MTKILLVEDDTSLREIYGVRLLAEGYDIVTADNGEIALAMAIKERPSLIITDVMMPKISGFDMLDILRSTTETKDIKVIMMTALGSEENKDRGERLGADRYLVKSQVGIEDVVRTVHDLLQDQPSNTPAVPAPGAAPALATRPAPSIPAATRGTQTAAGDMSRGMVSAPSVAPAGIPANQPPIQTVSDPTLGSTPASAGPSTTGTGEPPSRRTRVIQPINDPTKKVDIQALLDKELAKEAGATPAQSAAEEQAVVNEQLHEFAATPAPTPTPATPVPVSTSSSAPVPAANPSISVDDAGNIAPATPKPAPTAAPSAPAPKPVAPQTPPATPTPPPAPAAPAAPTPPSA